MLLFLTSKTFALFLDMVFKENLFSIYISDMQHDLVCVYIVDYVKLTCILLHIITTLLFYSGIPPIPQQVSGL